MHTWVADHAPPPAIFSFTLDPWHFSWCKAFSSILTACSSTAPPESLASGATGACATASIPPTPPTPPTDAAPSTRFACSRPQLDAEAELRDLERREIAESHDVIVFPGAARLLASLPPRRWAIVTSGTRDLASHRLRVAGLPVPELMITGTDIEHGKPHPEPYQRGAALLGLAPADCVAVEDAPNGIRSASDAGNACSRLAHHLSGRRAGPCHRAAAEPGRLTRQRLWAT